MTLFWLLTAAMIAAALLIIAPALLRKRQIATLDRNRQNIQIAQERLAELETDLENGALTREQFDLAKGELEEALLLDVDQTEEGGAPTAGGPHGSFALILIAVALPLLSLLLYQGLGTPGLIGGNTDEMTHAGAPDGATPSIDEMVKKLTDRLKEDPNDAEGWFMLGRSMMALERYPHAVTAFEMTYKLVGDEPTVLLSLADALAMANEGDMSGRPAELVAKALALEPDNSTALWLAGMVAAREGGYQEALNYWERLRPQVEESPEELAQLDQLIAEVRAKAGGVAAPGGVAPQDGAMQAASPAAPAGGASIRVRVELAAEMQGQVSPEDSVFIYAKAINGPRFPLAASRHQVKELPLEITLDDSSAMMPQAKLSGFTEVTVGARVSRSGNPIAQPGDLTGEVSPVAVAPEASVAVKIATRVE